MRLAVVLSLALAAALPAHAAETSSWLKETEVSKPAPGKPVKLTPAPKAPTGFMRGTVPGSETSVLVKPTGEDAAYIAFDQGLYLTAMKLAEAAAKHGDPQAHTLIGRIYSEGLGVNKDEALAAKWYARGAELGDVQATFELGVLYAQGRGVAKDLKKAGALFEKAALTGHPLANYNLGLLFLKGQGGKPKNPYRAAEHIRYAAEQGIAEAQYDLGGLYQTGVGVPPDALQASHWLRKAAEQGMPEAQFEYAVTLLRGFGLTRDEPKAIPYLKSAAQKGLVTAQNRLAYIYAEGVGVKKSPVEAAKWRLIAKAGGMKDPKLDALVEKLPKQQQIAAQEAATKWREDAGLF
jgi:uncharacterized protein